MATKSKRAFRTISEVADEMDVPQHVLRFWETRFAQVKPMKRGGNRRYYRPDDVLLLKAIQHNLYQQEKAIKDVQAALKDDGIKAFVEAWKKGTHYKAPKEAPKKPPLDISVPPVKPSRAAKKAAEKPAPAPKKAAADDDSIQVSKELVRALVSDLRALKLLIDRLPDK